MLKIYACVLMLASLVFWGCKTVLGQSAGEELDPTSLLTADNGQNEEKITLTDIKIPLFAKQTIFDNLEPTVNQSINFAAAVKDQLPQAIPPAADTPAKKVERQLRKSNLSPPAQVRNDAQTDDLRQIIEQIRSMNFEKPSASQVETQQPIKESPDTATEPNIVTAIEPEEHASQSQTPDKSMSDQTLKMVEDLVKDPNHIANPLELAEVLFKSGRPGPAGLCYKHALVSIDANDTNMAGDRAWILFQIGNCLKNDDPNTARQSFAELIRTQPNSPWAEIAKSEHGMVEWYQQESPHKLIQETKAAN